MRLLRLKVDGVGPLRGEYRFNRGRVTLIVDRNETGKSSLLAAISAALYGLEDDRRSHQVMTPVDRWRPWDGGSYRVELELKNVDKFIPWFAIAKRDEVFAGSYPFCAELLPDAPHVVFQSMPSFKPRAALQKALSNLGRSYGGILKAAHLAYGGDDVALLKIAKQCLASEPSRHLVESGVLTVDHEPVF